MQAASLEEDAARKTAPKRRQNHPLPHRPPSIPLIEVHGARDLLASGSSEVALRLGFLRDTEKSARLGTNRQDLNVSLPNAPTSN
jgi:Glu-tRNA(Gln) amidotransferase subunit E-like FAD-binding protein